MIVDPLAPTGDIVRDICQRFRQLDDQVSQCLVDRVEREARLAYGGEQVYIAAGRREDRRILINRIDPTRPPGAQAQELGLHRSTVWRHLKIKGVKWK